MLSKALSTVSKKVKMDASIEKIISVKAHPNADRLDLVQVLGFQCVTEKGLYEEGDVIVYIRPDAVLPPHALWADGYRKYSPKRIKAVRLRNEWSEGIIVPFSLLSQEHSEFPTHFDETLPENWNLAGTDVAEILGVTHYEPPLPQDLSAKRSLPFDIPKTDEKRWEEKIGRLPEGELVDITLKIDGQSWTAYYNLESNEFGVCGRSFEFKNEVTNNYTAHVKNLDIKSKLIGYCKKYNVSLAIRGESYGSGIQGTKLNPHSKESLGLAIFSVYNIKTREYERKGSLHYFVNACAEMDLPTVPVIEEDIELTQELIDQYSKEMKRVNGNHFEGVVVQHAGGSFKIINKYYDSQK